MSCEGRTDRTCNANEQTGHSDEWEHIHVYCEPCTKQMWQAVRGVPKLVEERDVE